MADMHVIGTNSLSISNLKTGMFLRTFIHYHHPIPRTLLPHPTLVRQPQRRHKKPFRLEHTRMSQTTKTMDIFCGGEGSSDRNGRMEKRYLRGAEHCAPGEAHEGGMMHCPCCFCTEGRFGYKEGLHVPDRELAVYYFRYVGVLVKVIW